jgi:uncharacterized membrane protein
MMFMAASCPSKSEAAVTILILLVGIYGAACSIQTIVFVAQN